MTITPTSRSRVTGRSERMERVCSMQMMTSTPATSATCACTRPMRTVGQKARSRSSHWSANWFVCTTIAALRLMIAKMT
eukprot:5200530-Pleurochrysis_carterae.AAC.1